MTRRGFLGFTGSSVVVAGTTCYLLSDKSNFKRIDVTKNETSKVSLKPDESEILHLASLAPSGHNTQPWFVKRIEPFHWIVCNDKNRWLPAVDPTQRETVLSIGAFLQTLEYAANNLGYNCDFKILAKNNQDEDVTDVKLFKTANTARFDIQKIKQRTTVRSNFLNDRFKKKDLDFLTNGEADFLHFVPNTSPEYHLLNQQTIKANRIQSYRNPAEQELANWIRFSSKEAKKHLDGLTTAGMEITGIPGWVVRNFYGKSDVMEKSFREQSIAGVTKQVAQSAGWILISSKGDSVETLLEAGKRLQRLFLKVRDRGIAIHPMTQILEEPSTNLTFNQSIGISDNIQFILRMGYLKSYPEPVSLRRPLDWFVRSYLG